MEIVYRLKTDNVYDEEGFLHTVYGIEALNGESRIVASISDVFFDKAKATEFITLCNALKLSLIHLPEVIEDILERE